MGWFDIWLGRAANVAQLATFEWSKWLPWAAGGGVLAAIGQMIESATVTEVVVAAVAVFVVFLIALMSIHAWRSRGRPSAPAAPQAPVNYGGGGHSAPVMTAGENSNLHYTYNDNRTTIFVLTSHTGKSGAVEARATMKFDLKNLALLDAFNISSITDVRAGHMTVNFAQALDPARVQGHSISASTAIAKITANSADIRYDESEAGIIEVKFDTTSGSG